MMRPNRLVLRLVVWFIVIALATIVIIYKWRDDQEFAKLKTQEMMLRSLMLAHSPPWTNVEFEIVPVKHFIIVSGTVENQGELDELRQELTNSGAAVGIYVNVTDTNAVK